MDGERTCRFSCTLVACTEARVGVIEVPIADGGYPDRNSIHTLIAPLSES